MHPWHHLCNDKLRVIFVWESVLKKFLIPMKLFKTFQKHIFLFFICFCFFFSLETFFKSDDGKNQEAKAAAAAKASKVGISKS